MENPQQVMALISLSLSLSLFPDGLEDEEEVDCEERAGRDAESAERLAGGRAQLRVVVRVERDDAHQDQQRGAHDAQQRLLQAQTGEEESDRGSAEPALNCSLSDFQSKSCQVSSGQIPDWTLKGRLF